MRNVGFDDDVRVPDAIFADPRLADLYDIVDDDRSDLDAYVAIVAELAASSVLDVGCGTGTLACRLALGGIDVVGLDPAEASLDVARRKVGADLVRWVHGTVWNLPPLDVDVAVMTGNVAQVFVTDAEWTRTLAAVQRRAAPPRLARVRDTEPSPSRMGDVDQRTDPSPTRTTRRRTRRHVDRGRQRRGAVGVVPADVPIRPRRHRDQL